MTSHFCLSITFLNGTFHGRRDDGVPEWPPSPLRAFQALVAAAAGRWKEPQFSSYAAPALEWLERLGAPEILAPAGWGTELRPYRLYVPNNSGDLVTRAWAAGNSDASIAAHRTEKDARPTHVVGNPNGGGSTVRFLWRLSDPRLAGESEFVTTLVAAARSVTHLGWGIDMATAHVGLISEPELTEAVENERLERWSPGADGTPLRVTVPPSELGLGTFRALVRRHESFTQRMAEGVPKDVPPLTAYSVVRYRRPTDIAPRPFAAFELRTLDDQRFRPFNTPLKTRDVAGMLRNAVERVTEAAGWDAETRAARVHGHAPGTSDQARGEGADVRFAYLPLPSIEERRGRGTHVGDIRRVMVVAHPSLLPELREIEQRLAGCELIDPDTSLPTAILKPIPTWDHRLRDYSSASCVWSTVTPVVLPGHEDPGGVRQRLNAADADAQRRLLLRLQQRVDNLLRKALVQAGFPSELVDKAEVVGREVGFRRGVEHARRYLLPRELTTSRYHVRVKWPSPVSGPISIGAGRYRGLGVFVAENNSNATG
jgi:CRISPR-associated protein Csb2